MSRRVRSDDGDDAESMSRQEQIAILNECSYMTPDERRDAFEDYIARWPLVMEADNADVARDTVRTTLEKVGFEAAWVGEQGSHGIRRVQQALENEIRRGSILADMLCASETDEGRAELVERHTVAVETIHEARLITLAVLHKRARVLMTGSSSGGLDPDVRTALSRTGLAFLPNMGKLTPLSQVLNHMKRVIHMNSIRRVGDGVYCEEERAAPDGSLFYSALWLQCTTHDGKPMGVVDMVTEYCSEETYPDMYLLQQNNGVRKTVVEELMSSRRDLPELKSDSKLIAFRNGLVRLHRADRKPGEPAHPVFCPYPIRTPEARAAVGYGAAMVGFDRDFNTALLDVPDAMDISTPLLDRIADHQEFSDTLRRDFYMLLGRLFYQRCELDGEDWQVILYVYGVAGSGKSTIMKLMEHFFPLEKQALLDDTIETKYGLSVEAMKEPLVFFAPEVTAKCSIAQSQFLQMASGERMSMARKHLTAYQAKWMANGVMFSNESFGGGDTLGQSARRLAEVVFGLQVDPNSTDPNLVAKMMEHECDAILIKFVRLYQDRVRDASAIGTGFWAVAGPEIKERRKNMERSCSPWHQFFAECPDNGLRVDPDGHVGMDEFKMLAKAWGNLNSLPPSALAASTLDGMFMSMRLKPPERMTLLVRGVPTNKLFLSGFSLVDGGSAVGAGGGMGLM